MLLKEFCTSGNLCYFSGNLNYFMLLHIIIAGVIQFDSPSIIGILDATVTWFASLACLAPTIMGCIWNANLADG